VARDLGPYRSVPGCNGCMDGTSENSVMVLIAYGVYIYT
jgi:hypothetical protein